MEHVSHGVLQSFLASFLRIHELSQFIFDLCGPVTFKSFLLRLQSVLIRNFPNGIWDFQLETILGWRE